MFSSCSLQSQFSVTVFSGQSELAVNSHSQQFSVTVYSFQLTVTVSSQQSWLTVSVYSRSQSIYDFPIAIGRFTIYDC